MGWTLRLPFRLAPTQTIQSGDLELGELKAEIIDDDPWRLLVVRDIATEREAQEWAARLAGALRWVAIQMG
jgi:hypothetical protein